VPHEFDPHTQAHGSATVDRTVLRPLTRRNLLGRIASGAAASLGAAPLILPLRSAWASARAGSNPYHKRAVRYAHSDKPAGWYWHAKQSPEGRSVRIDHFVKSAFSFQHTTRNGPARLVHATAFDAGRIKGAGKLDVSKLVPMSLQEIPSFDPGRDRLNIRNYSEGIEAVALASWRSGDQDTAIRVLRIGLTYAQTRTPIDIRLYDLCAGLLVRAGRDREIAAFLDPVRSELERVSALQPQETEGAAQCPEDDPDLTSPKRHVRLAARKKLRTCKGTSAYGKNLKLRLERWTAEGKWKDKWRQSALKWNGLDM
jgi:hypothetical protein